MQRRWVTMIIGAGLVVLAQTPQVARAACDAEVRTANLDFIVQDMDGNDVALSDYSGQVIILDFWATWCAPCRIEIPNFVELYNTYGPEGLIILGLSVDDPLPALQSFAAEFRMNYPVLVGADRDDVKDAYGPPVGYPTAFVIGRDGRICHEHNGFAPKERFEEEILALL